MNTNKGLSDLRKAVQGYYKKVAKRAGVSKTTVSLVLNDKLINEKVIKAATLVRDEVEKADKAKNERIAKLLNS